MGLFRVVVEATGGHGCQRDRGDGEMVYGCGRMNCPDCLTQEFVEKMAKMGHHVSKAEFIHWPDAEKWGGTPIVDEIVLEKRSGYMGKVCVKWEAGKEPEYEERPCVSIEPAHRIRHGYFPEHPINKKSQ